jgi:hypothetical protein
VIGKRMVMTTIRYSACLDVALAAAFSLAFFLDDTPPPPGTVLLPPRLNAELGHVHTDGSLHLALSQEDQREVITKGWGERHPLYSPTINVVMLYGPRTDEELRIAKSVIAASYRYATGNTLLATHRPTPSPLARTAPPHPRLGSNTPTAS